MVLDALLKIKNEQDPTLTFRRCAKMEDMRPRAWHSACTSRDAPSPHPPSDRAARASAARAP